MIQKIGQDRPREEERGNEFTGEQEETQEMENEIVRLV